MAGLCFNNFEISIAYLEQRKKSDKIPGFIYPIGAYSDLEKGEMEINCAGTPEQFLRCFREGIIEINA